MTPATHTNTTTRITRSLGAYLKATLQNAAITVLLFITGFAICGVPWWLLTGLLCGVLNLVPSLGSILSLGMALLIEFFATGDYMRLLAVGAVWLVVQTVEGFVLSPRAAGKAGVNPFLSIILVLAAGFMFGPIGMILAVPVTAVLLIIYKAGRGR